MTSIRRMTFESHGTVGVVEGPSAGVDQFLRNAHPNANRGKSKFVNATDQQLVNNGGDTVKVTTYEPVASKSEPLGTPSINSLFDEPPVVSESVLQPLDYQTTVAAQVQPPTKVSRPPLRIGNSSPGLRLPTINDLFDKPAETPGNERAPANSTTERGPQHNTRRAMTKGGEPLGLPTLFETGDQP